MRMRKCEKPEVLKAVRRYNKNMDFIKEFLDSGEECVEVICDEGEYSDRWGCTSTLAAAIKRMGVENTVEAFTYKGVTYMRKLSIEDSVNKKRGRKKEISHE